MRNSMNQMQLKAENRSFVEELYGRCRPFFISFPFPRPRGDVGTSEILSARWYSL